ncbi:MAG: hypothetical protein OIF58_11690, partial [Cohaesibacter sp.]|nr:hypothetical protein [Cohaesibacter sp.]
DKLETLYDLIDGKSDFSKDNPIPFDLAVDLLSLYPAIKKQIWHNEEETQEIAQMLFNGLYLSEYEEDWRAAVEKAASDWPTYSALRLVVCAAMRGEFCIPDFVMAWGADVFEGRMETPRKTGGKRTGPNSHRKEAFFALIVWALRDAGLTLHGNKSANAALAAALNKSAPTPNGK